MHHHGRVHTRALCKQLHNAAVTHHFATVTSYTWIKALVRFDATTSCPNFHGNAKISARRTSTLLPVIDTSLNKETCGQVPKFLSNIPPGFSWVHVQNLEKQLVSGLRTPCKNWTWWQPGFAVAQFWQDNMRLGFKEVCCDCNTLQKLRVLKA